MCNTNSKGRPLDFVSDVDGENKSILTLMSLIQNERLGAFHFILMCLGFTCEKKHMHCVSMFLSDGDSQIINSTKEFITTGLMNPKTKCRGFYHHGVTQVLLRSISKADKKAGMTRDAIKCFMNSCGNSFAENEIKNCWNCMIT